MKISIIILGFVLLFFLANKVLHAVNLKKEYIRKLGHVGFCAAMFLLSFFVSAEIIVSLCLGFGLVLFFSKKFNYLSGIHKHHVERQSFGELYLPLSVAVSALLFLPQHLDAFQFGLVVTGLADVAAELVGIHYGKHKIPLVRNKSWQGSFGFFLTTLIICFFLLKSGSVSAILISLILSVIEALLSFGLDNLILPVLATYLAVIIK
jgi:phytol kinase